MCAILGSSNFDRFVKLLNINKQRGNFSFGCLILYPDTYRIYKTLDINNIESKLEYFRSTAIYFAGHLQAPTSSDRNLTDETTHPFIYGDYSVAHNGVLTNFTELKECVALYDCKVDTSIIPRLISKYNKENSSELQSIEKTLSQLDGTHSTWIYNIKTHNLYITRFDSTLFWTNGSLRDEFSSINLDNGTEVENYKIYKYYPDIKVFNSVGNIKGQSHFFTL